MRRKNEETKERRENDRPPRAILNTVAEMEEAARVPRRDRRPLVKPHGNVASRVELRRRTYRFD